MKVILKDDVDPLTVVKRMVFLAFNACGGPVGMGIFQDLRLQGQKIASDGKRVVDTDREEDIWRCAFNMEDYPSGRRSDKPTEVDCDYVFGRMMKWGCQWDSNEHSIMFHNSPFQPDYQSFCTTYKDDTALLLAALESLGLSDVVKETAQK